MTYAAKTSALLLALALLAAPALAGDPSGENTFGDKIGTDSSLQKVAIAVDFTWTLMSGFLVAFMVLGFALLEAGFCRSKNAVNVCMKNVYGAAAGALAFWAIGFAFMFGGAMAGEGVQASEVGPQGWGVIGGAGFGLSTGGAYDVQVYTLFMFQVVFALTAVTIVSGAMAERTKYIAYSIYALAAGGIIYPIFGNWAWGGGFLGTDGIAGFLGANYKDFAGSGVVHMVGGTMALAGAWIVGPRLGKYGKNGEPRAMPGHSIPLATLGTIILWFGWFGFNAGSTLKATDLRISVIATNTFLAACAGAFAAQFYSWKKFGKSDPGMILNGSLAGLVAITAPSAYVQSWAAIVIGLLAGVIVIHSVLFFDRKMKIDDPVGAISVHMVGGGLGILSVGIFSDGTYGVSGLIAGNANQLAAQIVGMVVLFAWAFAVSAVIFLLIKKTVGLRVSVADEIKGLDMAEHGYIAYPDFALSPAVAEVVTSSEMPK